MDTSCPLSEPCRILLAESSAELCRFMTLVLEEEGHAVVSVENAEQAVVMLRDSEFDLVITDTFGHRPEDAAESVGDIVQAAGSAPVVLCTGHPLRMEELTRVGVTDIIRKPFDLDAFLASVNKLCSESDAEPASIAV